jgi:hypothetical protein
LALLRTKKRFRLSNSMMKTLRSRRLRESNWSKKPPKNVKKKRTRNVNRKTLKRKDSANKKNKRDCKMKPIRRGVMRKRNKDLLLNRRDNKKKLKD